MSCRVRKGSLLPSQLTQVKTDCTVLGVESEYGPPERVEAWGEGADDYYLPLAYARAKFPNLLPTSPPSSQYAAGQQRFTGQCRDETQKEVIAQATSFLQMQRTCLLSLRCGAGKTAMAIMLACRDWMNHPSSSVTPTTTHTPFKTAVLAHRTVLTDQWVAAIQRFSTARVQVVAANDSLDPTADFYLFNTATVPKRWDSTRRCWASKKIGQYAQIGILIVDEAHVACASEMSKALFHFQPWLAIALTATPKRRDGLDGVLDLYFGKETRIVRIADSPFTVFRLPTKFTPEFSYNINGKKDWNSVITALVNNSARNRLIVDLVDQFPEATIMILTKRIEHCDVLAEICRQREQYRLAEWLAQNHFAPALKLALPLAQTVATLYLMEAPVGEYNSWLVKAAMVAPLSTIEQQRLTARTNRRSQITVMKGTDRTYDGQARILISTYSKLGVGFDDPRLDMLIIACDVLDVEQYAGRLREAPGKNRVIIDLVDNDSNCLSHWRERRQWYLSRHGTVADYYRHFQNPQQIMNRAALLTLTQAISRTPEALSQVPLTPSPIIEEPEPDNALKACAFSSDEDDDDVRCEKSSIMRDTRQVVIEKTEAPPTNSQIAVLNAVPRKPAISTIRGYSFVRGARASVRTHTFSTRGRGRF